MSQRLNLLIVIPLLILLEGSRSMAEPGREFLLSCTYGVLAGALVGAATLAVEDNPSDKLNRVARGASLGLYTGILLGVYVVYVVPSQLKSKQKKQLEELEPDDYGYLKYQPPKLTVYPLFEQNKVSGAALNYNVINF